MPFQAGQTIGDYEILRVLGVGGMGEVYQVRNTISDRVEAMKVLLPNLQGNPALADRFLQEIKVQARLDHPNIAALHTAARVDNQLVMLIEFVEGVTVEKLVRQGPIPVADAVRITSDVLGALDYAHQHGVIHRDIKPANIMLTPEGTVKLMDFGIARLAQDRRLTMTGGTVGSLHYMSPEQIEGAASLDGRTDLYSLGITLYEMVTGTRPFQGDSDFSIMAAHLQAAPVPPIEKLPQLPPVLNDIILMAIAKNAAQRFQTAGAFRNALTSVPLAAAAAATVPLTVPTPRPAAAPPPAGATVAPAAPPVPQPVAYSSRRGLCMLAGSLATVAVLVLAALQLPLWHKTEAGQAPAANTSPASAPAAVPAPAQPEPATATAAPTAAPPAQNAEPSVTPAPGPQRTETRPAAPAAMGHASAPRPVPSREPVQQAPAPPQYVSPAAVPAHTPATQAAEPAAPSSSPGAAAGRAALAEARERLVLLATRVNPVRSTLATMQREQAAMGLGLRRDMAAAQQQMAFFMDEAEAALKEGDAAQAQEHLSKAERLLEKLERMLGR